MHAFARIDEVEAALRALAGRDAPLVAEGAGRREARWVHLFGGPPEADPEPSGPARPATPVGALADDLAALRAETADLRERVAGLEAAFEAFRRQFE